MASPADSPSRALILAGPALACFLATLLALEAISRWWVAPRNVRGGLAQVIALEDAVGSATETPIILFLGSSHTQCGIMPVVIERRLGLRRGAVLNAGLAATGPRERLAVYRDTEAVLGRARLAVIETSTRDFNRNLPVQGRLRGDLRARLSRPADPLQRGDWLLGLALSLWDVRQTWYDLATLTGRLALRRAGLEVRRAPFGEDGYPIAGTRPLVSSDLLRDAEVAAARHLDAYAFDDDALADLVTLVRRVERHGTRVVLLNYPVVPRYRLLEARYARANESWRAGLARALPGYPLLEGEPTSAARLSIEFRDADHLSRAGAIRFSSVLADLPVLRRVVESSVATRGGPADDRSIGASYMIVIGSTSTDTPGQRTAP